MKKISTKYLKSFNLLMNKFNNIIKGLLEKLEKEDISIESLIKIINILEDLIKFTKNHIFPSMTKYIKEDELLSQKLSDDFNEFKNLILQLFADIEASLINAKKNIKNKENHIDLSVLKIYLEFIWVLFNNFAHIFLATVSYANGVIDEKEYDTEYEQFKQDFNKNKQVFREKFEKD